MQDKEKQERDIIKKIITEGKYALSKPLFVPDINATHEITELDLPFSTLRARDIVEAQEEFETISDEPMDVFEANKRFHAYLVARMSKVPYDTIMDDMAVNDFSTLTLAVYRFLLRGV